MLEILTYTEQHKNQCLEIFDSNLSSFFDLSERDDFSQFLESKECDFFVFFKSNRLVACGGYHVSKNGIGSLCWGMVVKHMHKKKIGFEMTSLRIRKMSEAGVKKIIMDTSQNSVGFYQKLGFKIINTLEDGYGKGLSRIDLELNL